MGCFRSEIGIVTVMVLTRLPLLVIQIPRLLVKCLTVPVRNALLLLRLCRYSVRTLVWLDGRTKWHTKIFILHVRTLSCSFGIG